MAGKQSKAHILTEMSLYEGEKESKKENLIMNECLLDYFYSFEKKIEALLPLNKKTL